MYARTVTRAATMGRRYASTARNNNGNPWLSIPFLVVGALGAGAAVVAHYNNEENSGIRKIYKKHRNI
ncbi:uncharacterized protein GVI51_M13233 [Nakaseomyces glabratus]|uniref:uncharacterized protein n=1 Tax=Candida glabrata TaxID=5478 RepID=UPI00138D2AD7|nr:hypothetical protein J7297_05267 [Nakaseomyces glabratus]KAH7579865.1 hypothetical protein J7298_05264 [Nakaseomyces glabratus]KAH7580490.1 hypothetical protein J7296_05244 [Nakaseomyces glabratus]KAH7593046.1 hypothetical protein J7295_05259 [Nakaseomyces glabratus]KAH7594117.1 hypothetical protein J7294_05262 [Nakaseomyces glabratus]